MTGPQVATLIRSWVDYLVGWIYWAAVVAVTLLFAAAAARAFGARLPYVPTVSEVVLAYLAGAAYLLRR